MEKSLSFTCFHLPWALAKALKPNMEKHVSLTMSPCKGLEAKNRENCGFISLFSLALSLGKGLEGKN